MEVNDQLLKQLEKDALRFGKVFQEAATTVLDQEVSSYPIFIAHQHEVAMGILLVDRESHQSNWSFHISTLEEFVTKGIISNDRIEEFKKVYKNPNLFMCLFVLDQVEAKFVFYPFRTPGAS